MKLIEGADYFVRVDNVPFPATIGGLVTPNDDGTHTIILNARRSIEAQRESFIHELRHIARDDFHNDLPIYEVEEGDSLYPGPEALEYDTVEDYTHFVEEELGIRLNLSADATIEEVWKTVAFIKAMRDPWRAKE